MDMAAETEFIQNVHGRNIMDRNGSIEEEGRAVPEGGTAETPMHVIARIHTDFATRFGIPRQGGLVEGITGRIVFEPAYRNPDAVHGLSADGKNGFNYIWLIWKFSETVTDTFHASVQPPRLGANHHMGVFATRSPYRPNPIGLTSVKIIRMEQTENEGTVITVSGADMADNTPIYDIKPYIPYTDIRTEASEGFTAVTKQHALQVILPEALQGILPAEQEKALYGILAEDPRPAYQKKDPDRIYGFGYAGYEIRFQVENDRILTVKEIADQRHFC
jgi:tRNA-Thr(GGU) m(6)t(6)A37 methyltransferase TsaA